MSEPEVSKRPPGTCVPWEEFRKQIPEICGDEEIVQEQWEQTDSLAYMYVWQCLLSF